MKEKQKALKELIKLFPHKWAAYQWLMEHAIAGAEREIEKLANRTNKKDMIH